VQVFNNSWGTVYNQTFTNSPGTQTIPSLANGTYHVKVSFYTAAWSTVCDKSQDVVVQASGGGSPDCNNITIIPAAGSINVGGLTAPVLTVQAFNNNWANVYNQTFTNSPGSVTIPSLSNGTYHVKVNFSTSSWTAICEKLVDAVVSTTGSANTTSAIARENTTPIQSSKVVLLSSNPFKGSIKLGIELERGQKIAISILDVQGKTLFTRVTSYAQGRHQVELIPGSLLPGSYVLKVTGDSFTEARKVIKQ